MDNRLLIWFAVFLAAFLGLPIAMQVVRGGAVFQTQGVDTNAPAVDVPSSELADPKYNQPPLLNERNLVGTEWLMEADRYKIKITLSPNGVCYATHPMIKTITGMDYIEGRWRVNYDKVYVEFNIGGRHWSADLKISGNNLYSGTREIKRFTSF